MQYTLLNLLKNVCIVGKLVHTTPLDKDGRKGTNYRFETLDGLTGDFEVITAPDDKYGNKQSYYTLELVAPEAFGSILSGLTDDGSNGKFPLGHWGDQGEVIVKDGFVQVRAPAMRVRMLELAHMTYAEVVQAINTAEGATWDDHTSYVGDDRYDKDTPYTKRMWASQPSYMDGWYRVAVYCVTGGSEGIYLHIDLQGDKRNETVILGKTLKDGEAAMLNCYESAGRIALMLGA
jgi:hypothetical protein